jgi:hypothetical protein
MGKHASSFLGTSCGARVKDDHMTLIGEPVSGHHSKASG